MLGRDMWVISSGDDYSQFVGSGRIAHADQRNAPEHSDSGKTYNLAQLPPATAEQIAAHPWLTDTTLPQKVSALSPELGDIITSEQKNLKLHWGTEFRGEGTGLLDPNNPRTGYRWELITHKAADEYRIKRDVDGVEQRIVMSSTKWMVFSGDDYAQLLGTGQIAKP